MYLYLSILLIILVSTISISESSISESSISESSKLAKNNHNNDKFILSLSDISSILNDYHLDFVKYKQYYNKYLDFIDKYNKYPSVTKFKIFLSNSIKIELLNSNNNNIYEVSEFTDQVHPYHSKITSLKTINYIDFNSKPIVIATCHKENHDKLYQFMELSKSKIKLMSNPYYRTQLKFGSMSTSFNIGSTWTIKFIYLGAPTGTANKVSFYWIPDYGDAPVMIFYYSRLSGSSFTRSTLFQSGYYSADIFDYTNYGPGVFRLIDSKGYYDDYRTTLINPNYAISSSIFAKYLPPYSNNTAINWCSTNNPFGKSMCTSIKNQGNCGACWSFSATGLLESAYSISQDGITPIVMADEEITSCAVDAMGTIGSPCAGGSAILGAAFGLRIGMQPKSDYSASYDNTAYYIKNPSPPPCISDLSSKIQYRFQNYCKFYATTIDQIVSYLTKYGPATIAVDASTWSLWGGKTIMTSTSSCSPDYSNADHALLLVGWDFDVTSGKSYWIVRNSWSTSWGISGYARILKDSTNVCGVLNSVFWLSPCFRNSNNSSSTPSPTSTATPTSFPSPTSSPTVSPSLSPSPTSTPHPTSTPSSTSAPSPTFSPTPTAIISPTTTVLPTSPTPTNTPALLSLNFITPVYSNYQLETVLPIRWTPISVSNYATLTLLSDSLPVYTISTSINLRNGVYPWPIPRSITTGSVASYSIQVSCSGVETTNTPSFAIIEPISNFTLTVTSPALGQIIYLGLNFTVEWSIDNVDSSKIYDIFLYSYENDTSIGQMTWFLNILSRQTQVYIPNSLSTGVFYFKFSSTGTSTLNFRSAPFLILAPLTSTAIPTIAPTAGADGNPVVVVKILALSVSFTLSIDYIIFVSSPFNILKFRTDIATFLYLPIDQIIINKLSPGSTIVSFVVPVISTSSDSVPTTSEQQTIFDVLSSTLNKGLSDYSSSLYSGSMTSYITNATVSSTASNVVVCSNSQTYTGSTCPTTESSNNSSWYKNTTYLIIGFCLGILLLLICCWFLYRKCLATESKPKSVSFEAQLIVQPKPLIAMTTYTPGEINMTMAYASPPPNFSLIKSSETGQSLHDNSAANSYLPPGWTRHLDSYGNVYYFDAINNISSWNSPVFKVQNN